MLLAFHGMPEIKATYLARVQHHRATGQLEQKIAYWDGVGARQETFTRCIPGSSAFEKEMGIPAAVAGIGGALFEMLPRDEALRFPESFLSAIQPGADLWVWLRQAQYALVDPSAGVLNCVESQGLPVAAVERFSEAIGQVERLCRERCANPDNWRKAQAGVLETITLEAMGQFVAPKNTKQLASSAVMIANQIALSARFSLLADKAGREAANHLDRAARFEAGRAEISDKSALAEKDLIWAAQTSRELATVDQSTATQAIMDAERASGHLVWQVAHTASEAAGSPAAFSAATIRQRDAFLRALQAA